MLPEQLDGLCGPLGQALRRARRQVVVVDATTYCSFSGDVDTRISLPSLSRSVHGVAGNDMATAKVDQGVAQIVVGERHAGPLRSM